MCVCVCVNNYSNAKKLIWEINMTYIYLDINLWNSYARRESKLRNHPLLPFPYLIPEPFIIPLVILKAAIKFQVVSRTSRVPSLWTALQILDRSVKETGLREMKIINRLKLVKILLQYTAIMSTHSFPSNQSYQLLEKNK